MLEKIKNIYVRNMLSALIVTGFGFILLIATFLFYALIINLVHLFFPENYMRTSSWFMPVMTSSISIGLIIGYLFIFTSKLDVLTKATLMTVPTAVVLFEVSIALHRWPVFAFSLGAVLTLGALYYFYKTKQPWLYWFSVLIVAALVFIMGLTGTEI